MAGEIEAVVRFIAKKSWTEGKGLTVDVQKERLATMAKALS